MKLGIVVAAAENDVIGKGNGLVWRLPDDLKYFKAITLGKPIVMGRKTYESIGKPLPGRLNIVVTRKAGFKAPGCLVVNSLDESISAAGRVEEVMIIGGAEIYALALPRADVIYLTRVHARPDGDVFFPIIDATGWHETFREAHAADERHAYAFSFITLERKQ
ncbi:MAG: dihydrofolate reductase [Candidatus Obscuribacterales bacterium]|nr:dihydrofolate reductase [Steroidobacteraceae bacterium]